LLPSYCCSVPVGLLGGKRITGNNQVTTENRQMNDFTGVEVAGPYKVYLTQGNAFSVRVEAEENLMDYIITEKDGDVSGDQNQKKLQDSLA
jgi:hypothetical protein